jgi:hypothetical protein
MWTKSIDGKKNVLFWAKIKDRRDKFQTLDFKFQHVEDDGYYENELKAFFNLTQDK